MEMSNKVTNVNEVKTEGLNAKEVSNKEYIPIKPSKYFVANNKREYFKLYFSLDTAMNAGNDLIRAFDEDGNNTTVYKLGVIGYTTEYLP